MVGGPADAACGSGVGGVPADKAPIYPAPNVAAPGEEHGGMICHEEDPDSCVVGGQCTVRHLDVLNAVDNSTHDKHAQLVAVRRSPKCQIVKAGARLEEIITRAQTAVAKGARSIALPTR